MLFKGEIFVGSKFRALDWPIVRRVNVSTEVLASKTSQRRSAGHHQNELTSQGTH